MLQLGRMTFALPHGDKVFQGNAQNTRSKAFCLLRIAS